MDALAYRNRYGLLSEDIDPETGTLWGNFPQTYSMAGLILTANAALAKLGGSILARLIVVSNRVAVPSRDGGNLAGGLAVAVRSLLKRHEGLWFGWSGFGNVRQRRQRWNLGQRRHGGSIRHRRHFGNLG